MSTLSTSNTAMANFLRSKAFRLQVDSLEESVFFDARYTRDRELPDVSVPPVLLNNQSRPTGPGLLTELERTFFDYNGDVWVSDEGLADFAAALLELFCYDKPERVIEKGKTLSFHPPGNVPPIAIDLAAAVHNGKDQSVLLVLNASGKVRSTTFYACNCAYAAHIHSLESKSGHRL